MGVFSIHHFVRTHASLRTNTKHSRTGARGEGLWVLGSRVESKDEGENISQQIKRIPCFFLAFLTQRWTLNCFIFLKNLEIMMEGA